MTLKQLGKRLKRAKEALRFHKMLAKGVPTPEVDRLTQVTDNIEKRLRKLTDPKNAVRNALPKKKQRQLGLSPQV
jgi:hypothetical protein